MRSIISRRVLNGQSSLACGGMQRCDRNDIFTAARCDTENAACHERFFIFEHLEIKLAALFSDSGINRGTLPLEIEVPSFDPRDDYFSGRVSSSSFFGSLFVFERRSG